MDKRVMLMSGATVACALAIGFLMQPAAPPRGGPTGTAGLPELPQDPVTVHLDLQKITLTAAPRAAAKPEAPEAATSRPRPEPGCALAAEAVPQPGAMVRLSATAPCMGGGRVTVHHHGIMFTARLDADGRFEADVPVFAEPAVFLLAPETGPAASVTAAVEGLGNFDRVALQWSGNGGFELHALEDGAGYGEAGHVWHGAAAATGAGQVVHLGDGSLPAPRQVEIYSAPRGTGGQAALSVEAEITALNCGRGIGAEAVELRGGRLRSRELNLQVPDCAAAGGFLVLNNLLENLKIAAN